MNRAWKKQEIATFYFVKSQKKIGLYHGRPQPKWEDSIKMQFRAAELEDMKWVEER